MPGMPGSEETLAADVEKQLDAPMPWIGLYVALASLICTVAMAADTFNGFRTKKHWFPSKFFSLNATSLTLLAVAMKLPVDLTTRMYAPMDRLAKVSSMIFMSNAIGNLMACLGSMDGKEILMNVTALGILVFTVIVNVCIQIIQMRHFLGARKLFPEELIAAFAMLILLVMMISTAIMVPATKRYLELKYHEMLKMAADEQIFESMEEGKFTFDKLRLIIQKYYVMAETSSPQFVIARSVTCTASGVVCLLTAVVLLQAEIRIVMECKLTASKYEWSIKWIVFAQFLGVVVGTIAPLQIRDRKWRKLLHNTKGVILSFLVRVQILTVLCSKGVRLLSFCIANPIFSCFHCMQRLKNGSTHVHGIPESRSEPQPQTDQDLSRYVLLLEGEAELPLVTLTSIAIALPNMPSDKVDWLLKSVNEGLFYVKLIEKNQFDACYNHDVPPESLE